MHRTSQLKMHSFWQQYLLPAAAAAKLRVLDVGSKSYSGHDTYASLFPHPNIEYTGLDLEPGSGVDIVPAHPFLWRELADNQFDVCISGQTFEHNPLFWITFAEMARVLKPNGLAFVIAPGRGVVHRYPLDCWRFFPDAWHALCQYTGLELVETFFEDGGNPKAEPSLMWCDSCVIARKPTLATTAERQAFDAQLNRIASSALGQVQVPSTSERLGPALTHYLEHHSYRVRVATLVRAKVQKLTRKFRKRAA